MKSHNETDPIMKTKLGDLPDDIILLIIADLPSARDLRALALQDRRFASLVRSEGWRVFVRNRFPSLSIPVPSKPQHPSWRQLAESLTWQSRCWDRRSIRFTSFRDKAELQPQTSSRQTQFGPVVDVHVDPDSQEEFVVWGAGEDIVARYREPKGSDQVPKATWARSRGQLNDLVAGHDDITAISIIKDTHVYNKGRVFVAGRYNGDMSLLSAEPGRFGERLISFRTTQPPVTKSETVPDVDPDAINSIDVLRDETRPLIAASTKSCVHIYTLPEDDAAEVSPVTTYNLRADSFSSSLAPLRSHEQLCHATWMKQSSLMALALKGCRDPLRYLAITPYGCVQHSVAKNATLEERFDLKSPNICPHSLQPVQTVGSSKGGTSLLLAAWRDGTCRLQDLRTPSTFDMVYQDDVDTLGNMEVLMTYGTERFLGGGMDGATLKIFDFRWTRSYHHTVGLPCRAEIPPFPAESQPFSRPPVFDVWGSQCDHVAGTLCSWHGFSQHSYYRPNGTFLFSHAISDIIAKYQIDLNRRGVAGRRRQQWRQASIWDGANAIWSLAKASDTSPNFYIGVSGGIIEANLQTSDQKFGFTGVEDAPESSVEYYSEAVWPSFMETGDGRFAGRNSRSFRLPPMLRTSGQIDSHPSDALLNANGRLDAQFSRPGVYL